jgi:hypothetical protein
MPEAARTYVRTLDKDLPREAYEEPLLHLLAGRDVEFVDLIHGTHETHARLVPVSKSRLRIEAFTVWPGVRELRRTFQDVIEILGRTADYDSKLFRSALLDNKHGGHGVALYSLAGMPRTVQGLINALNSEMMMEIESANTAGFEEVIRRLSMGREGGPGSTTWNPWEWLKDR